MHRVRPLLLIVFCAAVLGACQTVPLPSADNPRSFGTLSEP